MEKSNEKKDRKQRKSSLDLSTMVYGKVPPQAREIEEVVLGAVMLEKQAIELVCDKLKPESFYVESHQRIYRAICSLHQKNQDIDILTVVQELISRGELDNVGGPYAVTKLTNSVVSSAHIESHAEIIHRKFLQRELIRMSGEMVGFAYEESTDVYQLLDDVEKSLTQIITGSVQKNYSSVDTVLAKRIARIEELRKSDRHVTGVFTGYRDLDTVTYGWQPTDLIILAARPSVGKTAFALNLARNAALHPESPTPVGFFSLEMSEGQLVDRLISSESEIFLEKISNGRLDDQQMQTLYKKGVEAIARAPIYIDDTAAMNIFELRGKARRMKSKHNVGLIIVDYLQLMSGTGERNTNREQEISRISRDLKGLAKELKVPIIALSQLSRETEKRKGDQKIPQLSDLRESGAIEQDADMVMFLYRPEYYDQHHNELGDSTKGETHVKIAKHRNGKLDTVKLRANLVIQKFLTMDDVPVNVKEQLGPGSWKPVATTQDLF